MAWPVLLAVVLALGISALIAQGSEGGQLRGSSTAEAAGEGSSINSTSDDFEFEDNVSFTFSLASIRALECSDTPRWHNGWKRCHKEDMGSDPSMCIRGQGWTCAAYVAKGWCKNNKCLPPSETGGVYACGDPLNSPEMNCCACGKFEEEDQCADMPNWHNGWKICQDEELGSDPSMCVPGSGWTCSAYVAKGWCKDDECLPPFGTGGVYACGPELNSPEENCCECGKDEDGNSSANACLDSPNWHNGWSKCGDEDLGSDPSMCVSGRGWTCAAYVKKGWCKSKKCLPPYGTGGVYACGEKLNRPEDNCCACGRGKSQKPPTTSCAREGCGGAHRPENTCQCTYECLKQGTCCTDYLRECSPQCGPRRMSRILNLSQS